MKSLVKIIVATIGIVVGALIVLYTPSNSWIFVLSFMYGAPIATNVGAYFLIDLIYSKTKTHPIVPFFACLVAELLLTCAGIWIVMAENKGKIMACADVCSETSFANLFLITITLTQIIFGGLYVGLIRFSIKWREERRQLPNQTPKTPTDIGEQSSL
ncbi:hypothetical protein IKP94_01750 [Candidatus Saccharibacteria bacterium]|nr:hypothetical protein [Candidatus Saccharibacteria bacterium]